MPKVKGAAGMRPTLDTDVMIVEMGIVAEGKRIDSRLFAIHPLTEDIQNRLTLHGLSALLQQRTSQIKGDLAGKLEGMQEVYDRLVEGEWNAERKAGVRTIQPIIEVLAGKKGVSIGQIQKAWKGTDDDTKAALIEKYQDDIAELIAGRETQDVDLDDLLG